MQKAETKSLPETYSQLKKNLAEILGILLSLLIAFVVAVVLIFVFSKDPPKTLYYFFLGPFLNKYTLGNMLEGAIPLIFSGLGIAVAFKGGVVNLGGEGQIFAGAIIAVIVGSSLLGVPRIIGIALILLSGILVGALIAGLSGFLRAKWKVSDLLTTYLISAGMVYVINYLILGPLRDPKQITIQSISIPGSFMLSKILPPSYLHSGFFIAIIIALVVYFVIYRTHLGYELRTTGSNPQFAFYGGIKTRLYLILPMLISGGLIGLGGAMQIVGRYQSCFSDLTAGLGWNGIAVALIARNNPLAVVPAALFYAYLQSGAQVSMINSDLTYEIVGIISSVIFYLVTAEAAFSFFKKRLR
ncbi:MAG: ABC transporter permease [Caldiserica bacterium]|jgi:simple sugar transport system permease protein|nr:ABC transporter permease [Caldisericota bacterium]